MSTIYLRDVDGTGSMHACSKGDPGAIAYEPRESTIRECAGLYDDLVSIFLDPQYSARQPLSSFKERFAVSKYRDEILALLPPQPLSYEGEQS